MQIQVVNNSFPKSSIFPSACKTELGKLYLEGNVAVGAVLHLDRILHALHRFA